MPRLALGWGASGRSSVLLPASTPNSGRPDVESPATPRLRRTGPAPTPLLGDPTRIPRRRMGVPRRGHVRPPSRLRTWAWDQLLRASFVPFVASCCASFRPAEHRVPPGEPHPIEMVLRVAGLACLADTERFERESG